jgi:hypothetical protein
MLLVFLFFFFLVIVDSDYSFRILSFFLKRLYQEAKKLDPFFLISDVTKLIAVSNEEQSNMTLSTKQIWP